MRIRIYTEEKILKSSNVVLNISQSHYVKTVLKLRNNDKIIIFNETSGEFNAEIIDIKSKLISVKIINSTRDAIDDRVNISVYIANIKKSKLEECIAIASQFSVSKIFISGSDLSKKSDIDMNRLKHIAIEGAEQSNGLFLPEISNIKSFYDINGNDEDIFIYGSVNDSDKISAKIKDISELLSIKNAILGNESDQNQEKVMINILIGSEGGFSEKELAHFNAKGYIPMNISHKILRCETALCGMLAICNQFLRD